MGTFNFLSWIKKVGGKFIRIIQLIIFGLFLNIIPRIFGEEILLKIILKLLGNLWEGIKPIVIEYWLTKPYLFELAIFLFALFILILIAFIVTQPPKGIKIEWGVTDLGLLAQIVVKNFTGYKLSDCYLEMNKAYEGKIFSDNDKIPNPLKCKYFENNEWVSDKLVKIDHTKSKPFWLASPSSEKNMGIIVSWNTQKSLKFEDRVKAVYQFGGTLPNGKVLTKDIEVTFTVSDGKIYIKKVWQ